MSSGEAGRGVGGPVGHGSYGGDVVILSTIYTRTGDDGTTGLGDGSRIPKTALRLAAYADVDEANSAIGVVLATPGLPEPLAALLLAVCNDMFDVGADLCTPVSAAERSGAGSAEGGYTPLRVTSADTARLETAIDDLNADLPALRSFVLPGGTPVSAAVHVARTVVRRAERSTWAAVADGGEDMAVEPARYLNRLSDLLFVLARSVNASAGVPDVLWRPAASRR